MRKATLLFATLLLFALAGTASADCISCNEPCTGPYGNNYVCNDDGQGIYGGCTNRANCRGCIGWIDQDCYYWGANSEQLEPESPAPLLGVQRVTSVVVRHDPAPVAQPVQIALAR